ncbi:MAG TPA: hypothetical protein VF041_06055 [Gemmatimonadaceae bacterium]
MPAARSDTLWPRVAITLLVATHLAVTLWHGGAHRELAVALSPARTAFVLLVIIVAPVAAAVLVWTRWAVAGVWVFFLSMLGALIFGVHHHYVLVSPDNVAHLPPGATEAHSAFIASAATLAVLELASTLYGALRLGLLSARPRATGTA